VLSQLFFTGSSSFLFGPIHADYHPRKVSLESPQLSDLTGQKRVGAEVLHYIRRCISLPLDLTLVLVIINLRRAQCL